MFHLRLLSFSAVATVVVLSACSSSRKVRKPVQVEDLDTRIEEIQPLQTRESSTVGLRDGVVIVQSKKSIPEEIRKLENQVYLLEDEIYGSRQLGNPGLYGVLKKCLYNLSDKRIGGHGKLVPLEREDRPTDRETQIRYGIDEKGRVISLSEEAASDRMYRFMEYRNILLERRQEFETRIDVCDQDYKNALTEQGLNASSQLSESTWSMDTRSGTRDWKGMDARSDELLRSKTVLGNNAQAD